MKTMMYNNERFWQITETSAIRPDKNDRIKILTIENDGSLKCISRTVKPSIREVVVQQFRLEA